MRQTQDDDRIGEDRFGDDPIDDERDAGPEQPLPEWYRPMMARNPSAPNPVAPNPLAPNPLAPNPLAPNPLTDLTIPALSEAAATARSMRRLAARVAWLEDLVRESDTVPIADLDGTDAVLTDLAAAVLAARDAEEQLLEAPEREALQGAVDWFIRLQGEREHATEEMLAISAAVENTARTDPVHIRHLARFADAEHRLAEADQAVTGYLPSASTARAQLMNDDVQRTALAEVIETGAEAAVALRIRLRNRLAAEAVRGALLPGWFTADLGPAPITAASKPAAPVGRTGGEDPQPPAAPAEPVDAGPDTAAVSQLDHPPARPSISSGWLEVAVAALAYRAVYGVDDQISLLGPEPAPNGPKHRRAAHRRLVALLAALTD